MNMERAVDILGINRTKDSDLVPMVQALKLFSRLNTPVENERLEAGEFVLRRWAEYQAECNTRRSKIQGLEVA